MTRNDFIRRERRAILDFDARTYDPQTSVGLSQSYSCACGFRTSDPGEIFDHSETHEVQGELFA